MVAEGSKDRRLTSGLNGGIWVKFVSGTNSVHQEVALGIFIQCK